MPKTHCKNNHELIVLGRDLSGNCRECVRQKSKVWGKENHDKFKAHQRSSAWKKSGIKNPSGTPFTHIDYDRAYQVQQGRCAGCGVHQSEIKGRLQADHDHSTGLFRFLLCGCCNRTLGAANDSPTILRKLADLLDGGK